MNFGPNDNPYILVLGSRRGLTSTLKLLGLKFFVCKDFRNSPPEDLNLYTHVLASGEGSVTLANQVRKQIGLEPIDERVITLCSDKLQMKEAAIKADIPVTPFLAGGLGQESSLIYQELGDKVVVKERNNSGGKGQCVFKKPSKIESSENDLIEGFITGKEMSVESFVQDGQIQFTSTTKYYELGVTNIVPSALEEGLLKQVLEINKRVIEEFNIQYGLTHLEVYLTEKGVLFGEIALRPPGGHIMTLIEKAHGFNPWELYINLHLKRKIKIPKSKGDNAASIIYHPGEGVIQEIHGEEAIKELDSIVDIKVRGKIGEFVPKRLGVGQERAHFIFSHKNRPILEQEIDKARNCFSMLLSSQ